MIFNSFYSFWKCAIAWHKQLLHDDIIFLLIIDIPLASLEDQKAGHINFLKEKIRELKLQMSSELQVPGNEQNLYFICNVLFI